MGQIWVFLEEHDDFLVHIINFKKLIKVHDLYAHNLFFARNYAYCYKNELVSSSFQAREEEGVFKCLIKNFDRL